MSRCYYLIYVHLFTHVYIPSLFVTQIKSKTTDWLSKGYSPNT